jgi:hypothetical protein
MGVRHTLAVGLACILLVQSVAMAQTLAPGVLHQSIEREARMLAQAGAPAAEQQASRKPRSWPGEHPILFGALVGAGAGAVWGGSGVQDCL